MSMNETNPRQVIGDLGKIVNPNGIQETFKTRIGGVDQWIYTRGQDRKNPVILFIHGGPASPASPTMWMYQRPIEEYFTVVKLTCFHTSIVEAVGADPRVNFTRNPPVTQNVKCHCEGEARSNPNSQ